MGKAPKISAFYESPHLLQLTVAQKMEHFVASQDTVPDA
jgi:hypothetical protein